MTVTLLPAPHYLRNYSYAFLDSQGRLIVLGPNRLADCSAYDSAHGLTMERFDKTTQTWTILAEDPPLLIEMGCAINTTNDQIMRVGGLFALTPSIETNTCDLYDPIANTWTSITSSGHFGTDNNVWVGANGDFFAGGGVDASAGPSDSSLLFERVSGSWVQRATCPPNPHGGFGTGYGRAGNTLTDSIGRKYFPGNAGQVPDYINVYNPANDTWFVTNFSPLLFGIDAFQTCIDVTGNVIYAVTPASTNNPEPNIAIARYNIANDTWTSLATLTTTLTMVYPTQPIFDPVNNCVYLFGITDLKGAQIGDNRVWKYDVASNAWSTTGDVTNNVREYQFPPAYDGVGWYFPQGTHPTGGCPTPVVEYFAPGGGRVSSSSFAAIIGQ